MSKEYAISQTIYQRCNWPFEQHRSFNFCTVRNDGVIMHIISSMWGLEDLAKQTANWAPWEEGDRVVTLSAEKQWSREEEGQSGKIKISGNPLPVQEFERYLKQYSALKIQMTVKKSQNLLA